ncbi:hypothetical protein SARC_04280 [Sphaeroforma arctica JP610]|uniref:Uncharacterized protein n=1 Tax=Sphaeroforma arctica JP610 TaxID=667725 RepID=A0A0L0G3Q6_9EUKA|nr:hypothetical protein SARC_04280 [Sphaeroforma arctica JP610]KNC83471.1 hypothetical protein SARC_04280 [Sphaeroforma arctica JP610]|eukprot:XP_014157373.1 hypothetical protein SARC_04280 [Sphaeroforma arctica JP610]
MRLTYTYRTTLEALYDRKYGSVYVALSKEGGRRWSQGWKTRLMCRIKGANSVTMPVGIQHKGDGSFYLIVNQSSFKQLCTSLGSEVSVSLWENPNTLGVDIPATTQTLLDSENGKYRDLWDKLTDGQKRKLCFKTRGIKTDSLREEKTLGLFSMFEESMIQKEAARKAREEAKLVKQAEKELKITMNKERKTKEKKDKLKAGKVKPESVKNKKASVKAVGTGEVSSGNPTATEGEANMKGKAECIKVKVEKAQSTDNNVIEVAQGTDTDTESPSGDVDANNDGTANMSTSTASSKSDPIAGRNEPKPTTNTTVNDTLQHCRKTTRSTRKRRQTIDDCTDSGGNVVGTMADEESLVLASEIDDEAQSSTRRSKRRRTQVVKYMS